MRYAFLLPLLLLACTSPSPVEVALTDTLSGRVVGQFDGLAVQGVTVKYRGGSAVTKADGSFTVTGSRTGNKLTFASPAILNRATQARDGVSTWKVVPADFDTAAYNDIGRSFSSKGTVRWSQAPKVYIDSRRHCFSGGDPATWANESKVQAKAFVEAWTAGTASPQVVITNSPPKDFTAGTIIVHFSECSSDYGGTQAIGRAHLSWTKAGAIQYGTVHARFKKYQNDPGKRKGLLGHELGHTLGFLHMFQKVPSLMQTSLGSKTDLRPFDRLAARFLYGRVARNRHIDRDASGTTQLELASPGYWEGE